MTTEATDLETTTIRVDRREDGVVVLTMDAPGSSANILSPDFERDLERVIIQIEQWSDHVKGVVLTSAKRTFFAGGDLDALRRVTPETAPAFADGVRHTKSLLRRLETLAVPVVAALNGSALGGGLEIALACHHRIGVRNPRMLVGFPEVTMGLLAGCGGIVRSVRLLGLNVAVEQLLLNGASIDADKALSIGVLDQVVDSAEDLLAAALTWIRENPAPVQPWDVKGYRIPGGPADAVAGLLTMAVHRKVKGANYPAPRAIVAAAVEGSRIGFDAALEVETRYFVELAAGPVAKNMIKANFFDLKAVRGGAARPDLPTTPVVQTLAIVGAGMMGAGLAYQGATAGIRVLLLDVDEAAAERGKDYARRLAAKAVNRGTLSQTDADALLARIQVVTEDAQLAGADAVIEAIVEDTKAKKDLFARIEPHLPGALLVSNTSTLPITELATGVRRPADFIGMHFFSPVDRMPLVEIIVGGQTSDAALARAFDLGLQLRKTPIVVNDGRGFFTSRVITSRMNEALAMIGEGIPAISVERASHQAGYAVGILQFLDEVTITLPRKVLEEAKAAARAAGTPLQQHPSEPVLVRLIDDYGRVGRSSGAGFYDFVDGKRTQLWPGLKEHFEGPGPHPPMQDLIDRLLFTEVLETAKCFDQGVLTSVVDANVGSLIGIAFPAWTGGVMQYVAGFEGGVDGFITRAEELATAYGPRFSPPASLPSVLASEA
jgi:3-hydroxyacyl-CoA dehydrogenase/enoyl-CoA hydratase/3-hydroxybutyryl-CoA epimerase